MAGRKTDVAETVETEAETVELETEIAPATSSEPGLPTDEADPDAVTEPGPAAAADTDEADPATAPAAAYEPEAQPVVAPRLFLTLGEAKPDPDVALVEIAASDLVPSNRRGSATNAAAVEIVAPADLTKRPVSTVFLIGGDGIGPAFVMAASPLEMAVMFGAGNGLHLPARGLVLTSVEADNAE